MKKIIRGVLILSFLYIENLNIFCFAQNRINDCFVHEYTVMSIHINGNEAYPINFSVMIEPNDTIELDLCSIESLVNSIFEHSLEFNDFSNAKVFYELYGANNEIANAYWFFVSEFNYQFSNKCDSITYVLSSGENVVISFINTIGIFLKYPSNDSSIISSYGNFPREKITFICPLSIFIYKKTETINIFPIG